MRLYEQEPFMESHHPAKCGNRRHWGSGDIMVLVCHVISQGHLIKGSCDLMCEARSQ